MHIWPTFLFTAATLAAPTQGVEFAIDAHVASNGSSTRSSSSCFAMTATIAEPVAAYATGGDYTLRSGFTAASSPVNDSIFSNAFEDCSS